MVTGAVNDNYKVELRKEKIINANKLLADVALHPLMS